MSGLSHQNKKPRHKFLSTIMGKRETSGTRAYASVNNEDGVTVIWSEPTCLKSSEAGSLKITMASFRGPSARGNRTTSPDHRSAPVAWPARCWPCRGAAVFTAAPRQGMESGRTSPRERRGILIPEIERALALAPWRNHDRLALCWFRDLFIHHISPGPSLPRSYS